MYIGIASGDNAIQAMRRRYDEYKKSEGINNMIAINESASQQNCRTVEDGLVAHFAEHKKNINRVGGGDGRHSSGPKYYVYLALRTPYVRYYVDDVVTGWPLNILTRFKQSIAQYCRSDYDSTKMYIGIGSGDDAFQAMKRRYDEYKKSEGVNNMIAIYESDSQQNCRTVEEGLVAHFEQHKKNINRVGGGGGRHSSGPKYYVYLALRISPAGRE